MSFILCFSEWRKLQIENLFLIFCRLEISAFKRLDYRKVGCILQWGYQWCWKLIVLTFAGLFATGVLHCLSMMHFMDQKGIYAPLQWGITSELVESNIKIDWKRFLWLLYIRWDPYKRLMFPHNTSVMEQVFWIMTSRDIHLNFEYFSWTNCWKTHFFLRPMPFYSKWDIQCWCWRL